jgi:site-specific DNA recombinase
VAVHGRDITRVIVRPNSIDIELREPTPAPAPSLPPEATVIAGVAAGTTVISLPWDAPAFASVKGVLHQPEAKPTLKQETRNAILLAVAKARSWIDDIASLASPNFFLAEFPVADGDWFECRQRPVRV